VRRSSWGGGDIHSVERGENESLRRPEKESQESLKGGKKRGGRVGGDLHGIRKLGQKCPFRIGPGHPGRGDKETLGSRILGGDAIRKEPGKFLLDYIRRETDNRESSIVKKGSTEKPLNRNRARNYPCSAWSLPGEGGKDCKKGGRKSRWK